MSATNWPVKTCEIRNHHMDSSIWDEFTFREGDIIVATYAKSGTTWVQQIVSQLLNDGQEGIDIMTRSPWLELRIAPREATLACLEGQQHRRSLKTHLPANALTSSPKAKYVYVARDGRDVCWSLYNHHANFNQEAYRQLNDTPGRIGPPLEPPTDSIREYFLSWLDRDGFPFWSFWENVRSWWAIRSLPNLLLVHYADLKADIAGEMRRIATFLGIPIDESRWPVLVEHCTFDYMKRNGPTNLPLVEHFLNGGAATFINKGTNGRWRDVLSAADSARYEEIARQQLGPACAKWLAAGRQVGQRSLRSA